MQNHQRSFRALGSDIVLTLVSKEDPVVTFDELTAYIEEFEERFSRFRKTSELTKVNTAAGRRITVSEEFSLLVAEMITWSSATDGLFNPFVLPKLQAAGYKGSLNNDYEPGEAPQYEERRLVDMDEINYGPNWVTLPVETALDTGGIGKGYLLARLAELVPKSIGGYWFSLGGDIAIAGRDAAGEPWKVGVAHALVESKSVGSFANDHGWSLAVATSGVTKRRGLKAGKAWHHIIDPRTGRSAETDVLTVSVASDDPIQADILAKCAVILGGEAAWEFLQKHAVRGAIIQTMGDNGEVMINHYGDAQ